MSMITKTTVLLLSLIISSCVSFNDITRPVAVANNTVCAEITFKYITKGSFDSSLRETELDDLSRQKILQVLSTFNITSKCETNKIKYEVKINRKISKTYEAFLGAWSVVTVLSVGLIPSYSSFETEISVHQDGAKTISSSFDYSAAVWLPLAYKQLKDDSFAFDNYNIDSRSSVIGIEIAKLIFLSKPKTR